MGDFKLSSKLKHTKSYRKMLSVLNGYFYDIDFPYASNNGLKLKKKYALKFVKEHDATLSTPTVDDVIDSLHILNKMVKSEECPSNYRNRFYHQKHKVVRKLLYKGYVDGVIESEKYYNFICGNYGFHQLKSFFPDGVKNIIGTEVYINDGSSIKYNPDEFRIHFFNILYYLNFISEKKQNNV